MNGMDETERLGRNNAIYVAHNDRAVTRWLEKRITQTMRQKVRDLTAQLQAEQAEHGSPGRSRA